MPTRYYISLPDPARARGSDARLAFRAQGAAGFAAELQEALRSDALFERWRAQQDEPDEVDPALGATDARATVDGKQWSRTVDGAGKVVVVNVWGSWCAPCVEETPTLQKVWTAYQAAGKPVAFIGVDIKEPADMGKAFLAAKGVTYPSISDQANESRPMLALAGKTPATPTTLVLDRQGRVAARVLGPVTESTLKALIDDAIAEP